MGWFAGLAEDARVSWRCLRRSPSFTLAATLSLALGLGGVMTVYAVADRLLLRPFDGVPDPQTLVELVPAVLPYPVYQDLSEKVGSVAGLAAHRLQSVSLELAGASAPQAADAGIVSGNYFQVLGVAAARGRLLVSTDNVRGAVPVAVLSHAAWTEMGAPENVLGSVVRVNGEPLTVVGVAASDFSGLRIQRHPAIWIPVESWPVSARGMMPDIHDRSWSWITVVGRLRPGVDLTTATADVRASAVDIGELHPENQSDLLGVRFVQARVRAADAAGAALGQILMALTGAVTLALLAAASNVAGLLLARATRRHRELEVRTALGAGRVRLGRLLAVESVLLVVLGLAGGFVFTALAMRGLSLLSLPGGLTLKGATLRPDLRLFGLASVLLGIVTLAVGVVPALAATGAGPARLGSVRASASRRSLRLRALFVTVQVAAGVVLVAGTALFGRSIVEALRVELGFDPAGMGVVRLNASLFQDDLDGATRSLEELLQGVRDLPGVSAAAWSSAAPLSQDGQRESFEIAGRPSEGRSVVEVNSVGPGFLHAVGIPLVRGGADGSNAPLDGPVAVVNETMASRYWPGADPVGTRLVLMGREIAVVAVAEDSRFHGFAWDPVPYVFVVQPRLSRTFVSIVFRSRDVEGTLASVRELARTADPRLIVSNVATGPSLVDLLLAPQRLGGLVALLAAIVAVGLTVTGVYGMVAYVVGARLREFGVRLALGAPPGRVAGEIMRRNLSPALGGTVLGFAASVALTRVAATRLYGLRANDLVAAGTAGGLVLAMALLAMWIPARMAGRVDPAIVLAAD